MDQQNNKNPVFGQMFNTNPQASTQNPFTGNVSTQQASNQT